MASRLFRKAPEGLILEEIRHAIAATADKLETERALAEAIEREKPENERVKLPRFARVYVGPVLIDPRDKTESFLVSYSDADQIASTRIDETLIRLAKLEKLNSAWFAEHGDPYLSDLRPA